MLLGLIFVFLSLLQEAPQYLHRPAVTSVKFKHSILQVEQKYWKQGSLFKEALVISAGFGWWKDNQNA